MIWITWKSYWSLPLSDAVESSNLLPFSVPLLNEDEFIMYCLKCITLRIKKILFLLNPVTLLAEYALENKRQEAVIYCLQWRCVVINCTSDKLRCICSRLFSKSPKSLICMISQNEIWSITDVIWKTFRYKGGKKHPGQTVFQKTKFQYI